MIDCERGNPTGGFGLNSNISRRSLLILGVVTLASHLLPSQVRSSEWIYSIPEPWQDRNWFILDREIASKKGLVTLAGPLGVYSRLHRLFLGEVSDLQSRFESFADDYLEKFGYTRAWAGFCHGLAHLNLGPQPLLEPETFNINGEEVRVTYLDRLGVGAAYHSGDIMNRPILGKEEKTAPSLFVSENLDQFIDELIANGDSFVINASIPGREGSWYLPVVGVSVDRSRILTTNFNAPGNKFISIPRGEINEVYRPLSWEDAIAQGLDERLFKETPGVWRYDDKMDKALVNRMLFGK